MQTTTSVLENPVIDIIRSTSTIKIEENLAILFDKWLFYSSRIKGLECLVKDNLTHSDTTDKNWSINARNFWRMK